MVGSEVEVGSRDGSDTPFCLGRKCLPLVVAGCRDDDFITMDVSGACGGGSELRLFLGLLLNLCYLLTLLGWGRNLHPQDDVPDFRLGQRGYVHTERVGKQKRKQSYLSAL